MRYCVCGKGIERRKEKGHREREYCSDACRQRAWRARNPGKHSLTRAEREWRIRLNDSVDQFFHRETWQDELEDLEKQLENQRRRNNTLFDHLELLQKRYDLLSLEKEMLGK